MRTIVTLACVAAAATAGIQHAAAQTYPDRPVRIVVNFPPGGSTDFSARILSAHLPKALGQSIVVDNRGGAGGNIGAELAAKSPADGYTLLVTPEGPITISPSLYPKLPFDALRDFAPVSMLIKYPNVVVVSLAVKVQSIKDLVALAKAQPGKISYAHPGIGTHPHLCGELFKMMAGVDMISVAYKGGGPAIIGVIGNESQVSFATAPSAVPHVKGGKLRAIAVTSGKRSIALPDLPTVAESGVPGYDASGWVSLFAPAKTPPKIVARINDETMKIFGMQEVKDAVLASGSEAVGSSAQELTRIVHAETKVWAKVIKTVGVKVE